MPRSKRPNKAKRRVAQFSAAPQMQLPAMPWPDPSTFTRRSFLFLLKWRIKLRSRSPEPAEGKAFLRWFKGTGVGAILLGGAAIMTAYFAFGAALLYLGLVIFCIDALCESMRNVYKISVVIACAMIGIAFYVLVINHKSPITFTYTVYDGHLELTIRNESSDDYQNVDLEIEPTTNHEIAIGEARQTSTYPLASELSYAADELPPGKHALYLAVTPPPNQWKAFAGDMRIRCDKMPRHSHIKFLIYLIRGKAAGKGIQPAYPTEIPSVKGQFQGKFRSVDVDTNFTRY